MSHATHTVLHGWMLVHYSKVTAPAFYHPKGTLEGWMYNLSVISIRTLESNLKQKVIIIAEAILRSLMNLCMSL